MQSSVSFKIKIALPDCTEEERSDSRKFNFVKFLMQSKWRLRLVTRARPRWVTVGNVEKGR